MKKKLILGISLIVIVLLILLAINITAPPSEQGLEHGRARFHSPNPRILSLFNGTLNETIIGLRNVSITDSSIYTVKYINFTNIRMNASFNLRMRNVDKYTHGLKNVKSLFAIDPTNLDYEESILQFTATANTLLKCELWNYTTSQCYGNWTPIIYNMINGRNYQIPINNTDPAFAQVVYQCWYESLAMPKGTWVSCIPGDESKLELNDGITYNTTFGRNGANTSQYGGNKIQIDNTTTKNCKAITQVMACYEIWHNGAMTDCDVSVDNDNEGSYTALTTACFNTTANPGIICKNATASDNWECYNFFGQTPVAPTYRALLKSEFTRPSGAGLSSTAAIDVLYMNISYTTHSNPYVNSVSLSQTTNPLKPTPNLTLSWVTSDNDSNRIINSTDWKRNGTSFKVLNLQFEAQSLNGTAGGITNGTIDYSTYGNNGTVYNVKHNKTTNRARGGEYVFAQSSSTEIRIPHSSELSPTYNITIDAWIKKQFAGEPFPTLISKGWVVDGYSMIFTSNKVVFRVYETPNRVVVSTSTIPNGNWTHVAGTYNGTHVKIYVNGLLENTTTYALGAIENNTQDLRIGSAGGSFYYTGSIGEINIYPRVLKADQIFALAHNRTNYIDNNLTKNGENWTGCVIPSNSFMNGNKKCTSIIVSISSPSIKPSFFNITMFNLTKRRFLNVSISTINSIINDTNVKLEIRGINGTHTKTNVSVNVTRRGNPQQTNLFFTALNRNGSFKVNTTDLKNLTIYGNYTIITKLSSNNGTNITTRNFTILNQMVVNKTMQMLPNSTPKPGSSINLTFNFTDDYAGSVDLNLTLRRRGGVIVQLNKTHFRLLGTPQNASPSRLQSNNFLISFNGTWNISAQFTDGNGSKKMSNYSFFVESLSSESPASGGSGSVPFAEVIDLSEDSIDDQGTTEIGAFIPAPFTPELTNLREENLKWSLTATKSKKDDFNTFNVLPNRVYRGSFRINNFDTSTRKFQRSCNGIFCDRVEYNAGSTPFVFVEGSNSRVVYFEYDTTGLNFFDSVEFNNIVTDNEGNQKIFTVFIEVSPFTILLVAWQWWVLGFIVMVLWILSIGFYYKNFSPQTKKSNQNIFRVLIALILLIGIGLAPLYLPVPITLILF